LSVELKSSSLFLLNNYRDISILTKIDEEEVDDEAKTDSGPETRPEFVFGPIFVEDDPLPDVLVSVRPDPSQVSGLVNLEHCDEDSKQVNW